MMKKIVVFILFVYFFIVPSNIAAATKQTDIASLVSITFNRDQLSEGLVNMLTGFLPEEKADNQQLKSKIDTIIDDAFIQKYLAAIVPLYDKQFTHKEIKQLLKFERSGLGVKTRAVIPEIMDQELTILVELMERHSK